MKSKVFVANYLFRPFKYIAGGKSLIYGLTVLLLLTVLSYFANVFLDGVISIHFGALNKVYPFTVYLYCVFVPWATVSLIFYLTALLLSKSSIRLVDMAGTLALAKTPVIFAVLFGFVPATHFPDMESVKSIDLQLLMTFLQDNIVVFSIMAIILIIVIVWSITLMYNAYSVSGNLKGTKGIVSFIIALTFSEIVSLLLFWIII
jgi:hypothetical protein